MFEHTYCVTSCGSPQRSERVVSHRAGPHCQQWFGALLNDCSAKRMFANGGCTAEGHRHSLLPPTYLLCIGPSASSVASGQDQATSRDTGERITRKKFPQTDVSNEVLIKDIHVISIFVFVFLLLFFFHGFLKIPHVLVICAVCVYRGFKNEQTNDLSRY